MVIGRLLYVIAWCSGGAQGQYAEAGSVQLQTVAFRSMDSAVRRAMSEEVCAVVVVKSVCRVRAL